MRTLLIAAGFALTSISTTVMAHDSHQSCNINFDKDISINNQQISISEGDAELWRINSQGQLWLDGKAVDTDSNTQRLLRDYQAGIRSQTLETVALVEDALLLATEAVDAVVTELTGNNLNDQPALQDALAKIRTSTESIVVRSGENIHIYGSRFDSIDNAFGEEFEQAIEQAVTSSMGSIFMIIGQAISSGEGNFEQRMEAFGERMERFGTELETRMDSKADLLEQRGESMCANFKQLDAMESEIQLAVPAMQKYDLFDVGNDNKTAFYLFN